VEHNGDGFLGTITGMTEDVTTLIYYVATYKDANGAFYADTSCPDNYVLEGSMCVPPPPDTCTTPNTDFPSRATNEKILFQCQEPDDFTPECTQKSGFVQERAQECITEYRCVKEVEEDKDKERNECINSYVSPTAGVFHEDIALVGTDINLHYQSEYLSDDTIASGWSLNIHHNLDGDYLHLGSGKFLNIKSVKSLENNTTLVNLGNESYLFDANNLHVLTKDNYTNKTLYTFIYNANSKLVSVADAFNNTTTLQRDVNEVVTSITASHGQINYLHVDVNSDLINVTYEDNSEYIFVYENHLMTSEKEPNGNEFLHLFDTDGRVTSVVDAEQGVWSFSKNLNAAYDEIVVNKASGDAITYRDYFLNNDSLLTQTITPRADIFSKITAVDGLSSTSDKCGIVKTINYQTQKDPITSKRVPSNVTTVMPSGLSKTTNYSQLYTFNADTLVKKESATESNGATTTTVRDYNLSTATITSPESRVSTVTYSPDTLLPTKIEVADLEAVLYEYNLEGKVTKIIQGSRETDFTYDSRGNLASEIDIQKGTTTAYSYDTKDRLTQTIYPDGHSVQFSYDSNGNRTKLTTPTPTDHLFEYNGVNKRTSMTSPLGYKTLYMYDKQRRVTKITRASGKDIINTYETGQLKSVSTPQGITNYSYDCGSKVSSIINNLESVSYTYDGDLLTTVQTQGVLNQTIGLSYNNDFRVTSLNYANATQNYTYDKDGYLTTASGYTITRDPLNAQATNISDGVLNLHQTYNQFGELSSSGSNNFEYILTRDSSGKIATKQESTIEYVVRGKKTSQKIKTNLYTYTYDNRDRLNSVKKGRKIVESYEYDANGNRLQATIGRVTTTASYTLDDNLEVYGNNTYIYDADGYLVEKTTPSETVNYMYNTLGALTSVTTPTKTITYHLNALNQRVAKEVDGVITEKYLWLNLTTLLAVYDGSDNLVQRFNYADSRMPISMTQDNQTYYLHYDQVGTLRAISDIDNNIIKEVTYDTFGNILSDTDEEFKIPFGFAGGLHDRDTDLVHFGYREYDSQTGKWTAKDPIDFNGGDSNLYGYVLGNPVGFIDPMGLWNDPLLSGKGVPAAMGGDGKGSSAGQGYGPFSGICGAKGTKEARWIPDVFPNSCKKHDECYSNCSKTKLECDLDLADPYGWALRNPFKDKSQNAYDKAQEGCKCQ
jgi:RHS repeat-associated protein